ncbi:MAG TPA: EAL domain-containing protein [Arenibaculum sp.]|nr:EAL domain-containing protein [Arenibaculum sp.]
MDTTASAAAPAANRPADPAALRAERNRFVGFAFAAADVLIEVSADGGVVEAVGAVQAVLGHSPETLKGRSFGTLFAKTDRRRVEAMIMGLPTAKRVRPMAVTVDRPGSPVLVVLGACRLPDQGCQITLTMLPDDLAGHDRDVAANLPDADSFIAQAQAAMMRDAAGGQGTLTLLRLKETGDGGMQAHDAVDTFLSDLGAFLRTHAVGDAAGRLDAHRFGVVRDARQDDAFGAVRRLVPPGMEVVAHDIDLAAPNLTPKDAARALAYTVRLFMHSDESFSTEALSDGFRRLLDDTVSRVHHLKSSIGSDIRIVFQPIVRMVDRGVHHHEVLARMPPGRPIQEQVGLAEEVGLTAEFDLAVCQLAMRRLESASAGDLAVNVSGQSIDSDIFMEMLDRLLGGFGTERRRLIFEITETVSLSDLPRASRIVAHLQRAGHRICIDDYGIGAASMTYLRALPVDFVKIDGSFIEQLPGNARDRTILRALGDLCRELGIQTVAERIEREDQARCLHEIGIPFGQGWLFGRPSAEPLPVLPSPLVNGRPPAAGTNLRRRGETTTWG